MNMRYPNIDAERSRHGMTYESLAATLGVTRKTLYNWMKKGNIPESKIKQMVEIFGCSADYLLMQRS